MRLHYRGVVVGGSFIALLEIAILFETRLIFCANAVSDIFMVETFIILVKFP